MARLRVQFGVKGLEDIFKLVARKDQLLVGPGRGGASVIDAKSCGSDDAKVVTCSFQAPEEVWILALAGSDDSTIGENDAETDELVKPKTVNTH